VAGSDPAGAGVVPLHGQLDALNHDIVNAFLGLPHRQLMVLGAPGAGKSVFALLLTLGLTDRRAAGEPVPVLLPINVWDPGERVDAFVCRRLVEDYADLLGPGDPLMLARRLVEHKQILPVLDGLDELPADAHTRAVNALDEFASAGRPVVVTCRVREYEQAVRRTRVLSRVAVIELEPVSVQDAITYLSQPEPDPRWEQVFNHLRAHPDGPLAQTLSTPLMVSLARIAYQLPSALPEDLLELPTRQAVANRLLDAFLASIYSGPFGRKDHPRSRRNYPATRAIRWLTYLAIIFTGPARVTCIGGS
jgi:NACHT domain